MKRRDFLALAPVSAALRLGSPFQARAGQAAPVIPVIIEAALNGGTAKSRNPNVPRVPAEIADDALRCLAAGAAIVHSHTDDPVMGGKTGRHDPAPYLEAWKPVLAKRPDALLYGTMAGGGPHTNIEERSSHVLALAQAGVARFAVIDTGTTNFGRLAADGLPEPVDAVYQTTAKDSSYMLALCERSRLGPSIAVYEPGFLRIAVAYARAGRMPPGAFVKFFFSAPNATWGLPPTLASLNAYLEMIKGTTITWAVAAVDGDVFESGIARLALERGGHVRVGLEDHLGRRKPGNEVLVREVAALAKSVGRPLATCDQAVAMIKLPRPRTQ